jgi:hypothetical protein
MVDLYNNKYSRQTLKDNIYAVKLIDILKTQTLDVTFVVRYILNTNYQFSGEDKAITIETVLKYQPHLSGPQISIALNLYDDDDDSVDDFETVSKKASWLDYIKTFESISTKVPDEN